MLPFYRTGLLGLVYLTLLCCCTGAYGQAKFNTSETIATATTTDNQTRPAIAQANNGNFIIVWESDNQDGSDYGIYAQVFDSSGAIIVPEYLVNGSTTDSSQRSPSVAMDNSGNYTIAWMSEYQDGDGWGCYRRGYNAAGSQLTSSSRLNSDRTGEQKHPDIAMDTSGNYVTVFENNNDDGDGFGIEMRRTGSNHSNLASSESVNDSTVGDQTNPAIGMDAVGNFVVVWQSEGTDGDGQGIYAKMYDNTGTVTVNQFRVNTTTAGNQQEPDVYMSEDGAFVIIWSSYAQDGDGYGIYAQRYTAAGATDGTETLINATTTGSQDHASIAGTRTNDYVISWGSYGQDGSYDGVYYQVYQADGSIFGDEARVNIQTTDFQQFPAIAWRDTSLEMVMTWQSGFYNSTTTQDGSGYGIVFNSAVVTDTISPVANCQNITAFLDGAGTLTVAATDVDDGSTDNVGIVSFALSPNTFTCSDIGSPFVTLTVTDSTGNTDNCNATVTVTDSISPTAVCTNITVHLDGSGAVTITGADLDGGSTDNCSVASTSAATTSFGCTEVGSNSVVLTVTDGSGNTSTCTGTVVVEDTISPTATCQDITVVLDGAGSVTVAGSDIDNGSTDNCSNLTFSPSPSSFTCTEIGSNSVTLTVTDPGGNTATCSSNVTVQDTTSPTAVCQDITAFLDGAGSVTVAGADVDAGSSDNCSVSSLSLNVSTFACADIGSNAYILTVSDGNGNSSTCTGTIQVSDSISPTMTCQNVTVQLDGSGSASITAGDIDASSTDNCSISTLSADVTTFSCASVPSASVILTGTDASGNSGTCTATVTVQDTASPVAVCQDVTLTLDGSGNATLNTTDVDNGSSDNCSVSSLALSQTSFACADVGSQSVTLTVSDAGGNNSTCTANITVEDTTNPTAVCQPITVHLGGGGTATITAADVDGGSSDNCSISSSSLSVSSFTCSDIGTVNFTLTVNDPNGNSNACTGSLVVADTMSPTMACQDITVQLDGGGTASITTGDIDNSSSDNCTLSSLVANVTSFTCTDVGPVTVTLTGTDNSGNSQACTSTVTVQDTISPTAICQNLTVTLDANGAGSIGTADIDNGTTDNCSVNSLSLNTTSFSCSDVGSNTVTLTATDGSGNTTSCNSTVIVQDTTRPVAVCQNVTLNLDGSGNATLSSSALDNGSSDACTINTSVVSTSSFTCADTGTTTITLTLTDANGNISTCTGQVTVQDITAPTMVCQDITVFLDGSGSSSITAGDIDGGTSDNCGINSLVAGTTSFSCSDVGTNNVVLSGSDVSSNSANCTAVVTVEDSTSPTAVCSNLTLFLDASGNGSITTSDIDGGSSDNCSISSFALNTTSFSCSDVGSNALTLTVTDVNSNTNTCAATVMVMDTTSPVAVCQNVTLNLDGSGNATLSSAALDNGSSDACTISSSIVSTGSFTCADTGTTTITLTVTDVNSNNSTCTGNVTIQDITAPVMLCQDITVQLDATGNASITTTDVNNGTSDNCGINSISINTSSFTCSDVGSNTVTLTATDISSNTDNCTSNVTIEDNIAPVALCQNLTVFLDGSGNASITSADVDNGSNDACGINSQSLNTTSFTCNNLGGNTAILSVTDVNGNTGVCSGLVQVIDTTSPSAVCQNITAYLDGSGAVSITAADIGSSSSDNCTINSVSLDNTSFLCFDVGTNSVTLTVNDQSGNNSTCIGNVVVEDTTSPVIACQNITVQLDGNGSAIISSSDIATGTSDNCGILSSVVSTTGFTCADIGSNAVTLTVDDINGNTSTCGATVVVEDNVAPTALCQGLTVFLDGSGAASITTADTDIGSSDACGISSMTLNTSSFGCNNTGTNAITLTVNDVNGNSANCNFFVEVIDSTAPNAVCQNLTAYLDASGNTSVTAADVGGGSSDNCSITSTVLSNGSFNCSNVGPNTVMITVDDPSNNVSTCTSVISVEDTISPTMICSDITVQLNSAGTVTITTAAIDGGTFDNCAIGSLQLSQSTLTCADLGVNSISLLAIDVNSNANNCQSNVTVIDLISPTALCQNTTLFLDGSGSATLTPADIDAGSTDNCGTPTLNLTASAFNCTNLGPNTIGLTAVDANGNTNSCTSVVTIEDTTAPVALCSDLTVSLGAGGTAAITTSNIDNGSSDNCNINSMVLSVANFGCSDIGSNSVVLTATDQSSNVTTCTSNVFVQDTNPPVVVCNPLTVTLDGNGAAVVTTNDIDGGSADNCSISSLTLSDTSFSCNDVGTVSVTMTGIDPFGNTSSCSASVLIQDTVPPNAVCVSNLTVTLNSAGSGIISLSDINNGSGDNCSIQTASISQAAFSCLDVGVQGVTLLITDANGNADSCVTGVFVRDIELPTPVCQNIVRVLGPNGFILLSGSDLDNGSSDNCGIASLQVSSDTLDCSNIGVNTVSLIATDPSGNVDSCTSSVTIQDNSAPIAVCQDITAYLDPTGNLTLTGNDVAGASSDNCGFTFSLIGNVLDCSDLGANQVFVTITDSSNLTASCVSNVTLVDSTPPVVTCIDVTVTLPASNNVSITLADVTSATPTDNCTVLQGSLDVSNFDCSNAGVNTVTVTVPDINGNSTICTSQVTVVDALPPTAICQDITVSIDAAGAGSITPADADNGSSDNCGIDSMAIDQELFSCSDVGQINQTLFLYDLFGNVDSCDFVVTVQDIIPPVALCTADTIGLDTGQVVFITGEDIDDGSSDNCGIASMVADPDSFTIADLGFNTVILTVTDLSGNTAVCNTTIFVEQVVGVEEEVTLDASVQFDAYPNPTQGILTIDVNCVDCVFKDQATLSLVDMRGKVLEAHVLNRNRGSHSLEIDMSQFAVGNYLLRLESERGTAVQQIIKY